VQLIAEVERGLDVTALRKKLESLPKELDRAREEALVAEYVARRERLEPLLTWAPGRAVSTRALAGADKDELLDLFLRMAMDLQLAEMRDAGCELAEDQTRHKDVCARLVGGKTERSALAKVDRRTLVSVERALARAVIKHRYAQMDQLPTCLAGCSEKWWDSDEEGNEIERTPTPAETKECEGECRAIEGEESKWLAKDMRAELRAVDKGNHAKGPDLLSEALIGWMEGFG
jgi:hypothetical protein